MAGLICSECGHENEAERVYCHSCGAKLDRSLLPKESDEAEKKQADVRKRVRKYGMPGRFTLWKFLKIVFSALSFGLLAASLIEMALPPNGVPKMPEGSVVEAPSVPLVLQDALDSGKPVAFDEAGINGYLYNAIRQKKEAKFGFLTYERTYVRIEGATIWITPQYSVYGYSFYPTSGYQIAIREQRLVAKNMGGYFGRLPIHPELMKLLSAPFNAVWETMKSERRMLDKMGAIRVENQKVFVYPTAPAR